MQAIVAVGIEKLQSVDNYSEWLQEMQRDLPDCYLPLNAVWSLLPKHIEKSFESYCGRCLDAQKIDTEIEESAALLWIWDRFDFERRMKSTPIRNQTEQPWMNRPGPTASNFREKAAASRALRLAGLTARRQQEEVEKRRSARYRYAIVCSTGIVGGWVLSPLGWPSVTLFLISAAYLAWSTRHKRYRSLCATICLFLFLFLAGGISRDLLDDVRPTALCSDGSYSYSAHHSGTCSWHGGVAAWSPTLHHWWQTILGA